MTTVPCIVCDQKTVEVFADLGHTALANKFLAEAELSTPEAKYPLRVGFCHTCGHVQLTERVPPPAMFEEYLYVSSASDTLRAHLYDLSDVVVARYDLRHGDLVIDVGCNDGTLLAGFKRHGMRTLGVDPARNLAAMNGANGVDRYVGFFNSTSAEDIVRQWGKATAITATNTFPHIPDLRDFVHAIDSALAPGGTFVLEAHYLLDMLEQVAFDTIYHEHVSYWALGPMVRLFEGSGFQIVHAERLPVHHGQLRVAVRRKGEGQVHPSVAETLAMEERVGLRLVGTYRQFAANADEIKRDLQRTLKQFRAQGRRIAGYGAPAKGNTLLSFLGIDSTLIEYIADRSPLKQGRYTPGMHIPVVSPDRLLKDQPDYVLLLAWNFAEEIMKQQAEYRRRGGRFIVPVPTVTVLS